MDENATTPQKRQRKTLEQQIEAKREELRKLEQRARNEERKARTKRLIEVGAIVEGALGIEFIEKDDRERLARLLARTRRTGDGSAQTLGRGLASMYNDLEDKAPKDGDEEGNGRGPARELAGS